MAGNANTEDVIQAWLLAKLAERLGIEPHDIDTREPLASYGLGSTEAVSLAGELADWLGRDLSAALVYEHPTIEALARHLAESPDVSAAATRGRQDAGAKGEPIAIIGVGCRFPGANGPGAFWQLLRDGGDAIREVPADRFDQHAFYDPDPATPGQDEHALGRVSGPGGPVRCEFLRHLAAGSVTHGPPATPSAGGHLGGVAGRRAGRPSVWPARRWACSSASPPTITAACSGMT